MDALDDREEGYALPDWEGLDVFTTWMLQMLRLQRHNLLLWGDVMRRCAWL